MTNRPRISIFRPDQPPAAARGLMEDRERRQIGIRQLRSCMLWYTGGEPGHTGPAADVAARLPPTAHPIPSTPIAGNTDTQPITGQSPPSHTRRGEHSAAICKVLGRSYAGHLASSRRQLASSQRQLASSQRQLTSSRRQLASSRRQLVSSRRQLASSRRQLASSRRQLASSRRQLASSDHQLASSDHHLASSRRHLAKSGRQVAASHQIGATSPAQLATCRVAFEN